MNSLLSIWGDLHVRVGREGGREEGGRMSTKWTLPLSNPCIPSQVFPSPSHYPRVCEIGVVLVVFVCLIRSVLLIGGYYTYSNLFLFGFPRSSSPCVPQVCAAWNFQRLRRHDTPLTSTLRLCSFLVSFVCFGSYV